MGEEIRGRSLHSFSAMPRQLSSQLKMVLDISCALWYLHALQPVIVHGDLKPSNLMVELRVDGVGSSIVPHVKLIDFGLSRVLSRRAAALGGTFKWVAPEVFQSNQRPAEPADIFGFGCIMHFIMTGKDPTNFPDVNWPTNRQRCVGLEVLCERCVLFEPETRPSAQQAHLEIVSVSEQGLNIRRASL